MANKDKKSHQVKNELVSDLMSLLDDEIITAPDLSHVCLFVAAFIAIKRGQDKEILLSGLRERYDHLDAMLSNVVMDKNGEPYYVITEPIQE